MPISITDAQLRRAATEKFDRAKALKQLALLAEVAALSRTTLGNGAYTTNDAAISAIFTDAVRAEEAVEAQKPVRIPADARPINFGPDAKHFAYFNPATSELFVGMTGEGAVVDENTLIEVLSHVNPYYLKTIYVNSFASIYPTSNSEPIDVFVCDLGKFDFVVCDFVLPAEEAAKPVDETILRSDALKTLRDLMLDDECVPHTIRADIAKYIIESRIG